MKTHKQNMYLFFCPKTDVEIYPDGFIFKLSEFSCNSDTEINITPDGIEVSCVVPEYSQTELLQMAISTLKEKQELVRAEAYKEEQRIQQLINNLLLLEHKPNLEIVG